MLAHAGSRGYFDARTNGQHRTLPVTHAGAQEHTPSISSALTSSLLAQCNHTMDETCVCASGMMAPFRQQAKGVLSGV